MERWSFIPFHSLIKPHAADKAHRAFADQWQSPSLLSVLWLLSLCLRNGETVISRRHFRQNPRGRRIRRRNSVCLPKQKSSIAESLSVQIIKIVISYHDGWTFVWICVNVATSVKFRQEWECGDGDTEGNGSGGGSMSVRSSVGSYKVFR